MLLLFTWFCVRFFIMKVIFIGTIFAHFNGYIAILAKQYAIEMCFELC